MSIFNPVNKVLILGKIPPPVGGVTIHVLRLLENLHNKGYNYFYFHNLKKEPVWEVFLKIPQYKAVHLHTSHVYFQLIVAVYCSLMNRKLIITYHGNWGRYWFVKNLATGLSSWFAYMALVQNQESLVKVKKWNENSILLSAYIPPLNTLPPDEQILRKIQELKTKYKYLFCTNASNLTFDQNGQEIYGISSLVTNISKTDEAALVVSDPSGKYKKYIKYALKEIPENIFFVTEPHDFWNVLKLSDAFIRNTTTDGDSISIHEAISCQIPVFATVCVSRPPECILFTDITKTDFVKELQTVRPNDDKTLKKDFFDTAAKVIGIYNECLS